MPPTAPSTLKADPNVFAAAYLAGCEAANTPAGSRLSLLKQNWHLCREFVEWVAGGEDLKDYEANIARRAAEEARKAAIAKADAEAEEARRQAVLAFNAK